MSDPAGLALAAPVSTVARDNKIALERRDNHDRPVSHNHDRPVSDIRLWAREKRERPGGERTDGSGTSAVARSPWDAEPHQRGATGRLRRRLRSGADQEQTQRVSAAIAWAKQGDPEAFRFLYTCYVDRVYGLVASIVRDEREAEDITQNVFLKLMTKLNQYEERDCPFLAWLLRVARNMAVDHIRQLRQVPCAEVFGADSRADDSRGDRARALRDALSTLPTSQREVLVLRHVAGMTPGEIAEMLERSEPSVHGLHNRGRAALRQALEALDSRPMVVAARA